MPRKVKVKPEECPGHEWIVLNTVKVCWHCTFSIRITGALTPEELEEDRRRLELTAKQKAGKVAKKARAVKIPDLTQLPKGIAGLLPAASWKDLHRSHRAQAGCLTGG